jgi:hypothetical protein
MGHSRRYCQVRALVRYPQYRTLPRPTESRVLGAASGDGAHRARSRADVGDVAQAGGNIARMKKQAMAEAPESALAGKGWLPPVLRTARKPDHGLANAKGRSCSHGFGPLFLNEQSPIGVTPPHGSDQLFKPVRPGNDLA